MSFSKLKLRLELASWAAAALDSPKLSLAQEGIPISGALLEPAEKHGGTCGHLPWGDIRHVLL